MNKVGPVERIARSMVYIWRQAVDRQEMRLQSWAESRSCRALCFVPERTSANRGRKATAMVSVKGEEGWAKAKGMMD